MKRYHYPGVLTIAGSDSGGGAGIQADLKTFSALGCFGTSAITAITVQNTMGVTAIHSVPAPIVAGQIKAVMDDIAPAAVKIGMIHTAELAHIIADTLSHYPGLPVILDPVMVASSGDKLIKDETIETLKHRLYPLAAVITPNLDEAAILSGMKISNLDEMKLAAQKIIEAGPHSVLLKGGHLKSKELYDVYLDEAGKEVVFRSEWIDSNNVHGTGCTLSSAIAAYMALGNNLVNAISRARAYTRSAIAEGRDVQTGKGHGPLNHFFAPEKLYKYEME
jgi:hydroxymethylpyrimidine/phosphomethylpyrimidine kinase